MPSRDIFSVKIFSLLHVLCLFELLISLVSCFLSLLWSFASPHYSAIVSNVISLLPCVYVSGVCRVSSFMDVVVLSSALVILSSSSALKFPWFLFLVFVLLYIWFKLRFDPTLLPRLWVHPTLQKTRPMNGSNIKVNSPPSRHSFPWGPQQRLFGNLALIDFYCYGVNKHLQSLLIYDGAWGSLCEFLEHL